MSIAVGLCVLVCQFLCPLLFFTDLTRNPYFTQIAVLNICLLLAAATILIGQARAGEWRLPKTPLDAPWVCWIAVCAFSWAWAYLHHPSFFGAAVKAEGLRVMAFTLVNAALPFYIAAYCAGNLPAQPDVSLPAWVAVTLVWGSLWTLFPTMRSAPGAPLGIWEHLWDPYGGLLWLAGLIAFYRLVRGGSAHQYWHLALAAGFLASIYGIAQYFNVELIWPRTLSPYGGRSVSTFGNPNFMSSYLVMLMPLALVYYLRARSWGSRVVYAVVFLAMEGCLLCSLTRSSWAGAAAALSVLFLSKDLRASFRRNLEAHGLLAAAAAAIILFWPQSTVGVYTPSVFGRIRELGSVTNLHPGSAYSPLYQRVLIWSCAWLMGKDNPLWGQGWGLFELFYPFYQGHVLNLFDLYITMRTHANNAHNEILEIWAQTGLAGVGVLFWIWVVFFVVMIRWLRLREANSKDEGGPWLYAAVAGVAGMLVDNLLNVSLHFAVPAFLFWWLAGTAMGAAGESRGERRVLRLSGTASSWAAVLGVGACCALGCRWWVDQWNREVHYFMGFKLMHAGRVEAAIGELETAYRWHSREVNTDYELGNAYARSAEYPKALWAYGEALKSNSGYDEIYFNTASVLLRQPGQEGEALKYFQTSYAINPLSQDLYASLAAFYLRDPARYRTEAEALLERANHFFPENLQFMMNLGSLYRQNREYAKAEDVFARALAQDPDLKPAEQALLEISKESRRLPNPMLERIAATRELEARVQRKDYSQATLKLARAVVHWFPKGTKARFYLGNLEMVNGNPAAALENLEPLVTIDPRNAILQRNLGEIYLKLGRTQDAAKAFMTSLQSDPGNAYVRQRLEQLGYHPQP